MSLENLQHCQVEAIFYQTININIIIIIIIIFSCSCPPSLWERHLQRDRRPVDDESESALLTFQLEQLTKRMQLSEATQRTLITFLVPRQTVLEFKNYVTEIGRLEQDIARHAGLSAVAQHEKNALEAQNAVLEADQEFHTNCNEWRQTKQ